LKKGNKKTIFKNSACVIIDGRDLRLGRPLKNFEITEARSLNNAFTIISERYRLGKAAHSVDIYKSFYTIDGKLLDYIRDEII
jgi:hypothetical protein